MAKHDENKDVRLISRVAKVNTVNKTIKAPKGTLIGIRVLGRLDYLTHHCGYTFIWDNSVLPGTSSDGEKSSKRILKKQKKEHQLTDKTKRNNKKKQDD